VVEIGLAEAALAATGAPAAAVMIVAVPGANP